ncbi:hypothetical protein OU995_04020 [Roseateles sp. SL47]|nr:hypothetical protein [Roseateles sp. SL47]WAC73911.1 hypothetical protein OU995_04020 [Roseateles sp. SL47]
MTPPFVPDQRSATSGPVQHAAGIDVRRDGAGAGVDQIALAGLEDGMPGGSDVAVAADAVRGKAEVLGQQGGQLPACGAIRFAQPGDASLQRAHPAGAGSGPDVGRQRLKRLRQRDPARIAVQQQGGEAVHRATGDAGAVGGGQAPTGLGAPGIEAQAKGSSEGRGGTHGFPIGRQIRRPGARPPLSMQIEAMSLSHG